jgi:hypothetical protein
MALFGATIIFYDPVLSHELAKIKKQPRVCAQHSVDKFGLGLVLSSEMNHPRARALTENLSSFGGGKRHLTHRR